MHLSVQVTPIPVKLGKFVLLTFREFDIETDSNPNKNCGYDYIKVEGEKYCGNNPPDFILSETNVMNVQFVTDDNTQLGGYIADWEEGKFSHINISLDITVYSF